MTLTKVMLGMDSVIVSALTVAVGDAVYRDNAFMAAFAGILLGRAVGVAARNVEKFRAERRK